MGTFGNAGPCADDDPWHSGDSKIQSERRKDNPMMSDASPSGSVAPETPPQKPPSRKTLYLVLGGVCIFLCACLCLVAGVVGVYGISTLQSGGSNSHRATNATWQVDVTSIRSSATGISDSTGGSVRPNPGYAFIIVAAKVKNVSGKSQTFYMSAANSNAELKDANGKLLNLAALKKGNSVHINFYNQVQMLFISSGQETYEFYFVATDDDRGPFTFTYMDLSPIGPLSLP
jgi:hypothetical protein